MPKFEYKQELDKIIEERLITGGKDVIRVAICCYDNKEKKIAIQKQFQMKDGNMGYTSSIGRFTKEISTKVYEAIGELIAKL